MIELFGFPETAGGLMTTGTSQGTLIALKVARDRLAGPGRKLVGYTSDQGHSSIVKAFDILGLGTNGLRAVASDKHFQMDIEALRQTIGQDRAAGLMPFCIIATAGTVNSAAFDDLAAIGALAREENLWLHVDGAFGAWVILSPDHKHFLRGARQADSLAFDFHKWLHVPYDAGCVLIRDRDAHISAFSNNASYLVKQQRGLAGGAPWYSDLGPDLSRGFRALKVWTTIKAYGLDALGDMIARCMELAQQLAQNVECEPRLQLLAPTRANIVCFRYIPKEDTKALSNSLNEAITIELHERGLSAPSTTSIAGKTAIRVNVMNHRTTRDDLLALIGHVLALGGELDNSAA